MFCLGEVQKNLVGMAEKRRLNETIFKLSIHGFPANMSQIRDDVKTLFIEIDRVQIAAEPFG